MSSGLESSGFAERNRDTANAQQRREQRNMCKRQARGRKQRDAAATGLTCEY